MMIIYYVSDILIFLYNNLNIFYIMIIYKTYPIKQVTQLIDLYFSQFH